MNQKERQMIQKRKTKLPIQHVSTLLGKEKYKEFLKKFVKMKTAFKVHAIHDLLIIVNSEFPTALLNKVCCRSP